MPFDHTFFIAANETRPLIVGEYNISLIVLSVVIAIFGSVMALKSLDTARQVKSVFAYHLMQLTSALSMAAGVWSMHFIGMLAYQLPTYMRYDNWLTALSLLPAFGGSYLATHLLSADKCSKLRIVLCGIILGAAIGAMHYLGMEAMETEFELRFDPFYFGLSIIVAVVLAIAGLWINIALQNRHSMKRILISGAVLGGAISGMHYVGMAAARYLQPFIKLHTTHNVNEHTDFALVVSATVVGLIILTTGINALINLRYLVNERDREKTRLNAVLDTAVDCIITINMHGIIQSVNPATIKLTGYSEDELLGNNIKMLMPPYHRDHHDGYLQHYLQTGAAKIIGNGREVSLQHKEGRHIPVRLAIGEAILDDDEPVFVGFLSDLTESKKLQHALQEREKRYSSLIANTPGTVFRCKNDEHWSMLFISNAVYDLCGWTPEDFISGRRNFSELIHPEDDEKSTLMVEAAINSRTSYSVEYRILHRDGHYVWILDQGDFERDADDNVRWIDGVLIDIDDRHRMEEMLIDAKHTAEQAAHAKASFLANMSHEIRTPMNAVLGFADLLAGTDLDSEQSQYLATITHSGRSLLHLLNDILDSAKLDQGKLTLEQRPFKLSELVDSVISTLWLQARSKGVSIKMEFDPAVADTVLGAPDRLRQVLMNLAGNAVKFTEKGNVTVSVTPVASHTVRFEVKDTGIGISEEALKHIFEPFTQADASMSRRFGGTGLGTTISRQLVELMGGSIYADSVQGTGSTFTFEIPLPATESTAEQLTHAEALLPPLHILVADDLPQNLTLLQRLLSRDGHVVTGVSNGREILSALERESFDIILTDVQMPELDGLGATREIRAQGLKNKAGLPLPIIALTASVMETDRVAARNAGMDGFATKPINMAELSNEIARVLKIPLIHRSAEQISIHQPLPTAESIDFTLAIKLWGSIEAYVPELERFLKEREHLSCQLNKDLDDKNWLNIREEMHAIAGVAGNLGLPQLAQACTLLGMAARDQKVQESLRQIQRIEILLPLIRSELKQHQKQPTIKKSKEFSAAPDKQAFSDIVNTIYQETLHGELNDDHVKTLKRTALPQYQEQVLQILHALDEFDFDTAGQHLSTLKEDLAKDIPLNATP